MSGEARKTHEHRTPCECGTNAYYDEGDEYYEVCKCSNCGRKEYVPLPD